jgi:hypothetical protein
MADEPQAHGLALGALEMMCAFLKDGLLDKAVLPLGRFEPLLGCDVGDGTAPEAAGAAEPHYMHLNGAALQALEVVENTAGGVQGGLRRLRGARAVGAGRPRWVAAPGRGSPLAGGRWPAAKSAEMGVGVVVKWGAARLLALLADGHCLAALDAAALRPLRPHPCRHAAGGGQPLRDTLRPAAAAPVAVPAAVPGGGHQRPAGCGGGPDGPRRGRGRRRQEAAGGWVAGRALAAAGRSTPPLPPPGRCWPWRTGLLLAPSSLAPGPAPGRAPHPGPLLV